MTWLDPTHLINTFGLAGLVAVIIAVVILASLIPLALELRRSRHGRAHPAAGTWS